MVAGSVCSHWAVGGCGRTQRKRLWAPCAELHYAHGRLQVDDDAAANADPTDPYADVIMAARQRQKARSTGDNPFHVTPLSGVVPPYSKASVSVRYTPTQPAAVKGFNSLMPTSDQVGAHGVGCVAGGCSKDTTEARRG